MVEIKLDISFDEIKRLVNISGTLMAIHCHHFNTNLFQTIEDAGYVKGVEIIKDASENVAFKQLSQILKENNITSWTDKLEAINFIYKTFGFGTLNLDSLSEDGTGMCTSPVSHLVKGWLSKFGKRDKPLCSFSCGFLEGALAAATESDLGSFNVKETQCISTGASECKFEVSK